MSNKVGLQICKKLVLKDLILKQEKQYLIFNSNGLCGDKSLKNIMKFPNSFSKL